MSQEKTRIPLTDTAIKSAVPMSSEEYQQFHNEFAEEMCSITIAKNSDYSTGADDALSNFRVVGNFADVPPEKAWLVLLGKHVTAVQRYVRDGHVSSEDIRHRLIDIANYCALGAALFRDPPKTPTVKAQTGSKADGDQQDDQQKESVAVEPTQGGVRIKSLAALRPHEAIEAYARWRLIGAPWRAGASFKNVRDLLEDVRQYRQTLKSTYQQIVNEKIAEPLRRLTNGEFGSVTDENVAVTSSMAITEAIKHLRNTLK